MRSYLTILILIPFFGISQGPAQFKYQSVVRDAGGLIIVNSPVGVQLTIHDLSATGNVVFQEIHSVTTNQYGLMNLEVGSGTPTAGTLGSVDWANGAKYLEIEADLTGGTSYSSFGTSQLLSVPYALHANTSGTPILPNGSMIGNTSFWDGTTWVTNSNSLFNDGNRIGIGTVNPQQKLDVLGHFNLAADSSIMFGNIKMITVSGIKSMYLGDSSGISNTFGTANTYLGYHTGTTNLFGSQNTFIGSETGVANNTGGMNSFFGNRAGFSNTIGYENTFIGAFAGQNTTEGQHNSFLGVTTGSSNVDGEENTFLGAHAGYFNVSGSFNSFVGNFAGVNNDIGNYNTILGFEADLALGSFTNASAFGYNAVVTASNSVMIGNTSVTSIGGQVGWSTFSDKQLKKKVQNNAIGLDFINSLRTVNYEYITEGQTNIRYTGLIAQEVESVLDSMNLEFSAVVKPKNEKDFYSIRYSEFVIPLIKATQEQSETINRLEADNQELTKRLLNLEKIVDGLNKDKKR